MSHPIPERVPAARAAAAAFVAMFAAAAPAPAPARAETLTLSVVTEGAPAGGVDALRSALSRTPGGASIEIAPATVAHRGRGLKAAAIKGDAALAVIPLDVLARESALYAAAAIPFLATTTAVAQRNLEALAPFLARRLEEDDLVLLALLPQAPIWLSTRRPIAAAADLRGSAIWTPDAVRRRLAEHLAAVPLPPTALGSAEAIWLPATAARSAPAKERQGWTIYALEGWHGAEALVIARGRLAAMPEASREALVAAAKGAAENRWAAVATEAEASRAALAQDGAAVVATPPALMEDLARIGTAMADEWSPGAGADGAAWLAEARRRTP